MENMQYILTQFAIWRKKFWKCGKYTWKTISVLYLTNASQKNGGSAINWIIDSESAIWQTEKYFKPSFVYNSR